MKISEARDFPPKLKRIPSTDVVRQTKTAQEILAEAGTKRLTILVREAINFVRQKLQTENSDEEISSRENLLGEAEKNLRDLWRNEKQKRLQKVINATGVVIHTNLGRAPLSENAKRAVSEIASGYCNLEYDLSSGRRGKRGSPVEKLLAEITGAESALVVNNCAAAAFLVLTVFAKGGEAIISRGELVEIGGDFRVPDVLEQSGTILKEVGTTNRTKISDYEKAVGENTRMLMRVHPSNYRIVGFTHAPDLSELVRLAHRRNLVFYEDAGSGALLDLSAYGLTDEPVISDSIRAGADVVTFSGDKLLGGAQSGLIVGKKDVVEKLRRHPLYRALRVDKMIYAALEATLEAFRRETAPEEIPVLKMIAITNGELKKRGQKFAARMHKKLGESSFLQIETLEGKSAVGGGSAPLTHPASTLLALQDRRNPVKMSAAELEESLRLSTPPVIARISEKKVLLDLRTVSKADEKIIEKILLKLFQ